MDIHTEKNKRGTESQPAENFRHKDGESTVQLPPDLGSGTFVTHRLEGGLELTLSDIRLDADLDATLTDSRDRATLVFSLAGRSLNRNAYFKDGFEMTRDVNCLYWSPDPCMVRQAPKGEALRAVVISFPRSRLGEEDGAPGMGAREGLLSRHSNSPLMTLALNQILECGFRGPTRRFFLESRALELVALKMDLVDPAPLTRLPPEQIQGVKKVRELLLKDVQTPPSIHSLARSAGMSHPLLNRCFKQAFGCTVFEFFRRQRLEISLKMVMDTAMTMTEIAHAAGFASSSHFSRAFCAGFGMPPDRYRKTGGKAGARP